MPTFTLGPAHWDDEVASLSRLLSRGGWAAHEVAMIERAARDRAQYVRSGVNNPTALYWTERIQNEIDQRTRMRWDDKIGWVLDRWAEGRWQLVGVIGFHSISEYVALQCDKDGMDYSDLIDYLWVKDMQRWPTPKAYIEYKRARAEAVRKRNEYRSDQQLKRIIDGMSDKRIAEFLTVERALKTGERVTLRGRSKQMFDRIAASSARSPAPPTGRSINPGHHPFWGRALRKVK